MRSSSRNRKTPDPQQVIIGDTAGATEPSAGAPTTKASKGKRRKTAAEKAAEDAAAASSAEASGALKRLMDSGQAVDPPGAALPPRKSILKVTWGDSDETQTAGTTPVTPPPPRDISPLLNSTPQAIRLGRGPKLLGEEPDKALDQRVAGWIPVTVNEGNLSAMLTWEHEETEPLNLRSMQGEASNATANEGPGLSNTQVRPSILEQTGMAMLPADPIMSEEDIMQENMENRVVTITQIKPPGQQEGGEGGEAYKAPGGSRPNGPWSPQGAPQVQCPEERETVGEYLRCRLHLPHVEQIASKDVRTAHVVSWWQVVQHARVAMFDLGWQCPRAKNLFKVGTGEGQWSGHAISERELAALVNLGSSTLSSYNSTMEEAMKVDSLWMFEDPSNDLKLQYAELGVTAFKDTVSRRYKKLLRAQRAADGLAEGDSSQASGDSSSSGDRNTKKYEKGKKRRRLAGVKTKGAQKKRKRADVSSSSLDD
ncbi:hypothetical protein JB92DRAFT_3121861 [Gautieria morchelliformis]|nr:hypothetical protein JB92DRAFT_3121861 [Gautieria morchelliformis]